MLENKSVLACFANIFAAVIFIILKH